jgi:hypothetical protein
MKLTISKRYSLERKENIGPIEIDFQSDKARYTEERSKAKMIGEDGPLDEHVALSCLSDAIFIHPQDDAAFNDSEFLEGADRTWIKECDDKAKAAARSPAAAASVKVGKRTTDTARPRKKHETYDSRLLKYLKENWPTHYAKAKKQHRRATWMSFFRTHADDMNRFKVPNADFLTAAWESERKQR